MGEQLQNDVRWTRLSALSLDEADIELPFSRRLARENGWDLHYGKRVVEEYKRFVYLAVSGHHPVTPSDQVDQAWHLHLVYSEHYWQNLCEQTLQNKLHHGPTAGGRQESDKYFDWYARTLQTYRRVFGEDPPPDIWPDPAARFRDVDAFRRVNTATHLVIPQGSIHNAAAAVGIATLLTGCGLAVDEGPLAVVGLGLLLVIVLWVFLRRVRGNRKNGGGGIGGGCGGGCGGCGGCGG